MLIPVTNEGFETIYINPRFIVSLKPIPDGTVITLVNETFTVHESIEHLKLSC